MALTWSFNTNAAAYKTLKAPVSGGVAGTANVVKFDGSIINPIVDSVSFTGGDEQYLSTTELFISINDTDSGWFDVWTATEVTSDYRKAFFNGWKYNGTTDKLTESWESLVDGSVPSTNTLVYVSANQAPNFTHYELTYQLAESVTEILDDNKVQGSLSIQGSAQVEVDDDNHLLNEVEATFQRSLKSVVNDVVTKQSDISTKLEQLENRTLPTSAYGLEWDKTTDSYTRIGSAFGLTRKDFDNIYPWSQMKRVNLADDGTVNAYYGDPTFVEDGTNGQVMVEIPKFYYRSEKTMNGYKWWVSKEWSEGFKLHPAFLRNGVIKDKFYFSAYEGHVITSVLYSVASVQPSTSTNVAGTIGNFRTYAQARGVGWEQQGFMSSSAIQLLLLVEYATFDSQSAIGQGVVNKASGTANESVNTGQTSFLGNKSGMANGMNGLVSVSYRGIENFWGNIWKWVDGFNIQEHVGYIADSEYVSDKFDGNYKQLNFTNSTSNGYVSDIGWTLEDDFMFVPTVTSGSSSSYLYDYYYQSTGNRVALLGGSWGYGSDTGAFCWILTNSAAYSTRSIGARLLYVPQ